MNKTPGVGFCGLLTILFIGLKLTNYIAWSWLWVLAPLWLPIGILLAVLLVALVVWLFCLAMVAFFEARETKRRRIARLSR